MPDITIEKCLYRFGSHAIPLISGEFHYWRVLRENWPAVIGRIREMGLDVVSTYIPWNYHELEPERLLAGVVRQPLVLGANTH